MSNVYEILRRASLLVDYGWAKGAFATDADGKTKNPSDPLACRWCAQGAIYRSLASLGQKTIDFTDPDDLGHRAYKALSDAIPETFQGNKDVVPSYNDALETTHDDVRAWFDRALTNVSRNPHFPLEPDMPPDDRLLVRTPLPGGGPVILLDPDREMPVFVSNDGKTIGVESLALNPTYSYAKQVLVPVDTVCGWMGFPSLFYMCKVLPDDKVMAPKSFGGQKCWTFEYALHLVYTVPVEDPVRTAALHEAWRYLTMASLQVCRATYKLVHDSALAELATLRERVKKYEEEAAVPGGKRSRLPPVFESTFPECSGTGWVEDGDVRVTYTTTGYIYLRFPRESHHRGILPKRLLCEATRHREHHAKYPSVVPTDTLHPVCFVDGMAEGDTIVVGFRMVATDLMVLRDRDDQYPDRGVFQEAATAFMQSFVSHRAKMRKGV